MWEKKYEQGRWNGLALNILSTSIDGGKRLHVSDIAYADLPEIKVMGSAASKLSIEVALVGVNSLVDANALLANLDKTPKGELEHPWLGELPLVFESYSQKIDTKLGLVVLSLSFVRNRKSPTPLSIAAPTVSFDVAAQSDEVVAVSSAAFVAEVNAASISEMDVIRAQFTGFVTCLQGIASKLSIPSQTLSQLHQELNSAMVAISSIANAPMQFAEQLAKTVSSIAKAVHSDNKEKHSATNSSRQAQMSALELIDPDVHCAHFNVQLVVAAVLMNQDIAELSHQDGFNVVLSRIQPAFILSDLHRITFELESCIANVTQTSTFESLELFNTLVSLRDGVRTQINKVVLGSVPARNVMISRHVPALALAHQCNSSPGLIMALNSTQHPLFLCGTVALEVAS